LSVGGKTNFGKALGPKTFPKFVLFLVFFCNGLGAGFHNGFGHGFGKAFKNGFLTVLGPA